MKLKPYPEYQDTSLEWLGRVPAHWEVLPNRSIFSERIKRNMVDEELLSVTISRGVLRQSEFLSDSTKKDSSNEDKTNYKLVLPDDIAYNKMRMWQGAVGASRYRGIVSSAYIVLKSQDDINSWYYHFLMRTPHYTGESYRHSYGICDDQLCLRYEDFKTIQSPIPPRNEQDAIVMFLNSKLAYIRSLISNKRRLIELLQEQKQAIINSAVTRGLNPDVPLKPSGVEWLGDVPEHWDVAQVRSIARVVRGGTPRPAGSPLYFHGTDEPWITVGEITKDADMYLLSTKTRLTAEGTKRSRVIEKGTFIDWLGDVPEHWVIKPLKRWVKINQCVLSENTETDYAFDYLDIGTVGTGCLVKKPERIVFSRAPSRARRILKKGDTIISTVRTYLRAIYYIQEQGDDLIASTGFAVLTPDKGIVPEYLAYFVQSNAFIDRVVAYSVGIAYPAISETKLGSFHVALPREKQEQEELISLINTETLPLNESIQRGHREINLIREYRTRLIADVVTGKVDVRGILVEAVSEDEALEEFVESEEMEEPLDIEEVQDADY